MGSSTTLRGKRKDRLRDALPAFIRMLRRFSPYLAGSRGTLISGVLALLMATAMRLLEPWPLKFIIDRVVRTPTEGPFTVTLIGGLTLSGLNGFIALCAVGLALVIGLRALFQFVSTSLFAVAGSRALTGLRRDLFAHLQKLPPAFHDTTRPGDLTLRLIGDVGMLKDTATTAVMPLLTNVFILTGMVAVMMWLDWTLALLTLLPVPVLLLMTTRIGNRIKTASRVQRKREASLADSASEMLGAIRSVQALRLEEATGRLFQSANGASQSDSIKTGRLGALMERSVDVMIGLTTAAVLWFGTHAVLAGRLTPGDLLVFLTYLKNTFRPLRDYAKYSGRLAKASAAAERVFDLLDTEPEIRDRAEARPAPVFQGHISFDRVGFDYPDGRQVLKEFSLDIPAGQSVALIGPSGIGKSTIFWLLLRLREAQGGTILIDGTPVDAVTLDSLRAQITFLPQDPVLFAGTVAENIALGAGREVSDDDIRAAARLAGAEEFITAMPDGYDTEVAERGANFSGGQRQRIALARAALRQTPILMLDEPTVGLDAESEAHLRRAILRLARDRTTLIITHDLTLARCFDRVILMGDGRVQEDGTPDRLAATKTGFARLFAHQSGGKHALQG